MHLYLVRHARGVPRSLWQHPPDLNGIRHHGAPGEDASHDDRWRPLSRRGREQADLLLRELAPRRPERIVCGPARRCRETVQPLAERLGLPIEIEPRLDESGPESERMAVVEALGETPAVLCTHGPAIAAILDVLETGADASTTRKGAYWELFGPGLGPVRARYVEPRSDSKGGPSAPRGPSRVAVLDLGSTSFHLMVAERTDDGGLRPIARSKEMLRLGASLAGGGAIPPRAIRRALAVVRDLREVAEREKAEWLLPVATAALREAPNGARVAQEISAALDMPVRILSGPEEARVIFRAFQHRLGWGDHPLLALDLGGGSLELAAGHGRHVHAEVTLPLGAVRLREERAIGDPMTTEEIADLRAHVRASLAPHRERLVRRGTTEQRAVAAGGTVRAIADLLAAIGGRGREPALPAMVAIEELDTLAETLARSTQRERLAMKGMRRSRADILHIGALVVATAAHELGLSALTLCDWGLREGIVLEAFAG